MATSTQDPTTLEIEWGAAYTAMQVAQGIAYRLCIRHDLSTSPLERQLAAWDAAEAIGLYAHTFGAVDVLHTARWGFPMTPPVFPPTVRTAPTKGTQ